MSQQVSSDAASTTSAATSTTTTTSSQPAKVVVPIKLDSMYLEIRFHIPVDFAFSVLRIIRLAQQQHGLRHGDYQRYR